MNIVIVGAGAIGSYIAKLLTKEENNVILVDSDEGRLETLSRDLDLMTRVGSGTDWQLLDDLMELSPQLLLAMTSNDETNLVCCSVAKNLGYPETVARVHDERYFNRTRLDFERIFAVDHLVGPELLVAHDIVKTITSPGSVNIEIFAHGAAQMRTLRVPEKWRLKEKKLHELGLPEGTMVGLIHRQTDGHVKTIFPHGSDSILPKDEVTFIGETEVVSDIHRFLGITPTIAESVVVVGGTLTGINLARLLERQGMSVRVIDRDYDRCVQLNKKLPSSTIVHHDAADLDFLKGERVAQSGFFVTCTHDDQANLLIALLAKQAGCKEVIAVISDTQYIPIVRELGISHVLSPRVSAANRVLSYARSQAVASMVSLYEGQAEILEVKVSLDSRFVGIPIAELGPQMPDDFLIALVQNRGRIMIANGNRVLSPGDTMVVITAPRHIQEFSKVF